MVTTREQLAAAENEERALEKALRSARERLAEMRRQGVVDEPAEGGVVRFKLRMQIGMNRTFVYNYAALRIGNCWFTTGKSCPKDGYRWESLWRFINDHELVGDFEVATFESDELDAALREF